MTYALSFAQVQAIRERFASLSRWSGLPIAPDRLDGHRIVRGHGVASLLKFAEPMVGADGGLGDFLCYTPSLRRFAIHPRDDAGPWRVSENTIGVMVNPTRLSSQAFAYECYRYLLAREAGEAFEAAFLQEPVLWPKTLTHLADLEAARKAIADLRLMETVVHARDVFGARSWIARWTQGAAWFDLDWRDEAGNGMALCPASASSLQGARTWRMFLDSFLSHAVAFTLHADGRRSNGETRGSLTPAPILIVGATHTGRTNWATGERADDLVEDPDAWQRVVDGLAGIAGAELTRAGLAPRTVRAMRTGRRPVPRNAEAARRLVAERARADAGLKRDRGPRCAAPGCPERLTGRQRTFCTQHASFPGSRRKAWKEAAGR
jgi:hypothetical protein